MYHHFQPAAIGIVDEIKCLIYHFLLDKPGDGQIEQASILDDAWERSIAYIQRCCDGILCKHVRWPSQVDLRRWFRNRSWSRYIGLDRLQSCLAFLASFLAAYGGKNVMSSGDPLLHSPNARPRTPAKDFVLCTPFNYGIDH